MLRLGISVCLSLVFFAGVAKAGESEEISQADKAAILQLAFELKLEKEGPEKFAEYLTISTENMSRGLLPNISGFEFKLMKPTEIRKRQKKADRFRYVFVSEFDRGSRFVRLALGLSETCRGLPCHSHSYQYVFEKVEGKWQGRIDRIIC